MWCDKRVEDERESGELWTSLSWNSWECLHGCCRMGLGKVRVVVSDVVVLNYSLTVEPDRRT